MSIPCDRCAEPASRFAHQWFQFPRDPHRYTALCETHWDGLLENLEWLAGSLGRCPRCYARLAKSGEGCHTCRLAFPAVSLKQAA